MSGRHDPLRIKAQEVVARLEAGDKPNPEEYLQLAKAYAKLSSRFSKVLAISDKYQSLIQSVSGDRIKDPKSNTGTSGKTTGSRPSVNMELLQSLGQHPDPGVRTLVKRFEKLENRLNKIVTISDVYQSELRESTLKLELMSKTDPLTGLPNRRDMMERLEIEALRSIREDSPYSVILFDIDDFKAINDKHGHAKGDQALIQVAETFRSTLRRTDSCARWGGEEFLILCPGINLEQAQQTAEKCRSAIQRIGLTISGGICSSQGNDLTWEQLILNADTAMYESKTKGKDQVSTFTPGNTDHQNRRKNP